MNASPTATLAATSGSRTYMGEWCGRSSREGNCWFRRRVCGTVVSRALPTPGNDDWKSQIRIAFDRPWAKNLFMRLLQSHSTLAALALAASLSHSNGESPVKRLEEQEFGKTPEGAVVELFTLRNAKGMSAKVMTYGASITEITVPDRRGSMTNVVLGADDFDQYRKGFPASAAVIGRVANRIAGARFTLDGVEYKLAANNGPNHIHGGRVGFASVLWQGKALPV